MDKDTKIGRRTTAPEYQGQLVQIIVFRLANEEYALEISQIKEVVPTPSITKVPLTPAYVEGVANIRGNILAVVDLEKKFELNLEGQQRKPYTLVVESEDLHVGFLVSEVPNTLAIPESSIDQSPAVVHSMASEKSYIKGIVKHGERLIILLDLFSVIAKQELQKLL